MKGDFMNFIKLIFLTVVYFLLIEFGAYLIKRNNEGLDFNQKKKSFLVVSFALITSRLI